MYGYELIKAIRLTSNETINLAEGVVYPILHALEAQGALRSKDKTVNGRARVYYSVTAKGNRRLARLKQEWEKVSSGINTILGDSRA